MNLHYKYYRVTAKCGHVGRNKCIPIDFPILACNKKEAVLKALNLPRVKRHHKDCIFSVNEISLRDFNSLIERNLKDQYLKCKSKREQKMIENLDERIIDDEFNLNRLIKRTNRKESRLYRVKKQNAILKDTVNQIKIFKGELA